MYNVYKYVYCDRVLHRCPVPVDSLVRKPAKIAHRKCAHTEYYVQNCLYFLKIIYLVYNEKINYTVFDLPYYV